MNNSQISRRRFLKGLAAVPVGAALAGRFSSVFAQTPAPAGPVTGTVSAVPLIIKAPAKTTKAISDIDICENMFVGHNSYSDAIEKGMSAAAKHYGCKTTFGGPPTVDHAAQAAEIETWITQKKDAITALIGDAELLTPSINKAVDAGIIFVTWDSDAFNSKRTVFWSQANDEDQAIAQIDELALEMNYEGEWGFVVGQLTQAFKMLQYDIMKKRAAEKYPKMKHVGIQESNDDITKGAAIAKQFLVTNPDIKGIISNSGGGFAGVAQGIRDAGMSGKVAVTGLSIPSTTRQYFKDGTIKKAFLWDMHKYGYGLVSVCLTLLQGQDITPDTKIALSDTEEVKADIRPNLGNPNVLDLVMGPPLVLTKENIDNYDL
jgi:rhamnose transport system substrate-binding protein